MWRDVCTKCGRGHSTYGSCRPVYAVRLEGMSYEVVETEQVDDRPPWKKKDVRTVGSCTSEEAAEAIRRLIVCTSPPMPG